MDYVDIALCLHRRLIVGGMLSSDHSLYSAVSQFSYLHAWLNRIPKL